VAKSHNVNRYKRLIEKVFFDHYKKGAEDFEFDRDELIDAAKTLGFATVKNVGDVIYAFRYRQQLPAKILATQPKDKYWLILGAGDARYRFRLSTLAVVRPTLGLALRKIPDATPEIIAHYAFTDEQALLGKIRYNRLIDVFLGITAYSLQSHLRTRITNYGQIEIDELYVGIDARAAQYVVPVQAKGGKDTLGVIQTIQDTAFCQAESRYANSIARPVSAQFMQNDTIALFELHFDGDDVSIIQERHYRLVESSSISGKELKAYQKDRF
jgi:hypothetical protein